MTRSIVLFVAAIVLFACGGSEEGEASTTTTEQPMATSGSTSVSGPTQAQNAGAPAEPLNPEALAARFLACTDFSVLPSCLTAETRDTGMVDTNAPPMVGTEAIMGFYGMWRAGFPDLSITGQLLLLNGHHVVGIGLVRGTHTGTLVTPMGEVAATNRPISFFGSRVAELDAAGHIINDSHYGDLATLFGQIGQYEGPHRGQQQAFTEQPIVVIAANSETETANLNIVRGSYETFSAHNVNALVGLMTEDAVLHDLTQAEDVRGRSALRAYFRALFTGFPDVRATPQTSWAAGDYVIVTAENTGTNRGRFMGQRPTNRSITFHSLDIYRMVNGKAQEAWFFANGMAIGMQLNPPQQASAAAH